MTAIVMLLSLFGKQKFSILHMKTHKSFNESGQDISTHLNTFLCHR